MSVKPKFQVMKADLTGKDSILDRIVRNRHEHLEVIAARIEHVLDSDLKPSTRSLYESLGAGKRGDHHFIMECKAASPSLGLIRDPYNPGEIAKIYSQYASAISVLCEPEFFGGAYEHLTLVAASTHLPVLCKDFFIDKIQVRAARYFGADAILLMLSVLNDEQYTELADLAHSYGMDVVTEVSNTVELERARKLKAKIVGINNRNLRDLSIDVSRSAKFAHHFPADVVVISESGIRDHATVRALGDAVSGFLVGSQLTSQPNIDVAARKLVFGEAKVCGLTAPEAAQIAYAAGATYGGLIFVPRSPRNVSLEKAVEIAAAAPRLQWVAVTVSEDAEEVGRLAREVMKAFAEVKQPEGVPQPHLVAVQVHVNARIDDNEDFDPETGTAFVDRLREALPDGVQLWRALDMKIPADLDAAYFLADDERVDRLVLDAGPGGTGCTFDWTHIPSGCVHKSLIAGGIGASNCCAAMATGAVGVDFNSRLEYPTSATIGKARKDEARIRAAFEALARTDVQQPTGMTKVASREL